jgi:hypothetical protein
MQCKFQNQFPISFSSEKKYMMNNIIIQKIMSSDEIRLFQNPVLSGFDSESENFENYLEKKTANVTQIELEDFKNRFSFCLPF